MLVLTIRTDNPQAEIGLYDDENQLSYLKWDANRTLSTTIHQKIEKLLQDQNTVWKNLDAIVCYKGPGSFTGLRIGLATANSLAYGLHIPIVSQSGENWKSAGIKRLHQLENEQVSLPFYGQDAFITSPRK